MSQAPGKGWGLAKPWPDQQGRPPAPPNGALKFWPPPRLTTARLPQSSSKAHLGLQHALFSSSACAPDSHPRITNKAMCWAEAPPPTQSPKGPTPDRGKDAMVERPAPLHQVATCTSEWSAVVLATAQADENATDTAPEQSSSRTAIRAGLVFSLLAPDSFRRRGRERGRGGRAMTRWTGMERVR